MKPTDLELHIVMPVHNEAQSIEATVREWHDELSPKINLGFVLTEDGSKDDTKNVLRKMQKSFPMLLDMSDKRRGYADAVVTGFRATSAPYVLAVDSDGQCDPKDFWQFWKSRDKSDVQIGWRVNRNDNRMRKIFSGSFKLLHSILFSSGIHDPSCPYVLIQRQALNTLVNDLGQCTEGFWWEFVGRTVKKGLSIHEFPINHRKRAAGETVVFKLYKMPGIATSNAIGLIKVWAQTRSVPRSD